MTFFPQRNHLDIERPSSPYFFAALNFAQRARAAAAILFFPAADIVRLGFGARPSALAQRAFCARLIRLRAEADTPLFGFVYELPPPNLPRTERAASTCRSSFARVVLAVRNSDTKPASPLRFAMNFPSRGIVADGLRFVRGWCPAE